MILVFLFVIVTMEIAVGWTIYVYTSMFNHPFNVYPPWLWELLFSFYWFVFVFKWSNYRHFDITRPQKCNWDLRAVFAWGFVIHLISAYVLTYSILPRFGFALFSRVLIAYGGSYLLSIEIPMRIAIRWYPRYLKNQASERVDPVKIHRLALQCAAVREFSERLSPVNAYVYDHVVKNQVATCVFQHRMNRSERPGLLEDVVLSVSVDMRVRKPLEGSIKIERYIFSIQDGRSSVLHLPSENLIESHLDAAPLDEITLQKFELLFDRFPSLENVPFALAVRNASYVQIGSV